MGDVSKRDITEASAVKEKAPLYGAVLAFNVKVLPDAEEEAKNRRIPIFKHNIIYHLIDEYLDWMRAEKEAREKGEFEKLIRPAKLKVLPGYVFRRAKPAIVGVQVLAGQVKPRLQFMTKEGKEVGEVLQIQDRGETVSSAAVGKEVAVSFDKAVVGRHFNEGDILYVRVPESHARDLLAKFRDRLSPEEIETLEELAKIRIREDSLLGNA